MPEIYFIGPAEEQSMINTLNAVFAEWVKASSMDRNSKNMLCQLKCRNVDFNTTDEAFEGLVCIENYDMLCRRVLFGAHYSSVPQDEIFAHLKENLTRDLVALIRKSLNVDTVQNIDPVENLPGDRSAQYVFLFAGVEFSVVVPAWLHAYCVAQKAEARRLRSISVSEINKSVELNVKMSLGRYKLESLSKLSKGDVLSSELPLTHEPGLFLKNNKIARVRIGKKNQRKAIVISEG